MTAPELVTAVNASFVDSYRKLAQHCAGGAIREVNGPFAFVTGVPIPMFNGCLALEPVAGADLAAAVTWIQGANVPYQVWIEEHLAPDLDGAVKALRLERESWLMPGMVLVDPPAPPPPAPGVSVIRVRDDDLSAWLDVLVDVGMPRPLTEQLFPPSFVDDPDVTLFLSCLNDRPVGTAIAIRSGDVSGVYSVITLPDARVHGVGTAAAWAAVDAGREWGCDVVVLQATEMGFNSYRRMGFETVTRYLTLEPAAHP